MPGWRREEPEARRGALRPPPAFLRPRPEKRRRGPEFRHRRVVGTLRRLEPRTGRTHWIDVEKSGLGGFREGMRRGGGAVEKPVAASGDDAVRPVLDPAERRRALRVRAVGDVDLDGVFAFAQNAVERKLRRNGRTSLAAWPVPRVAPGSGTDVAAVHARPETGTRKGHEPCLFRRAADAECPGERPGAGEKRRRRHRGARPFACCDPDAGEVHLEGLSGSVFGNDADFERGGGARRSGAPRVAAHHAREWDALGVPLAGNRRQAHLRERPAVLLDAHSGAQRPHRRVGRQKVGELQLRLLDGEFA